MNIINKKLIEPIFVTVLLVGFLNFLAMKLYLFWTLMWFDMVMHFLGGFMISLIVAFFVSQKTRRYSSLLIYSLLGTLIVGILWEVFEAYFKLTFINEYEYFSDTGMDMVMDMSGALIAVFYSYYKLNFDKN